MRKAGSQAQWITIQITLQISSRLCHSRVEELLQVVEGKLLSVSVPVPLQALVLRPLLQVVRSFVACSPTIGFQNLNQMTSFNTIEGRFFFINNTIEVSVVVNIWGKPSLDNWGISGTRGKCKHKVEKQLELNMTKTSTRFNLDEHELLLTSTRFNLDEHKLLLVHIF